MKKAAFLVNLVTGCVAIPLNLSSHYLVVVVARYSDLSVDLLTSLTVWRFDEKEIEMPLDFFYW